MPASSSVSNLYPALASLDSATFDALAASAESWLVQYLGRNLQAGTYTETFSGQNQPLLFLKNTPVTAVTQIVITSGYSTNTYTPASNYYYFSADGQLHLAPQGFWNQLAGWRPGVTNIAVTYTSSGFDQPTQDLLIGSVMNWFNDQAKRSGLVNSETIGNYSYTMRSDFRSIPPAVNSLLYQFRGIQAV